MVYELMLLAAFALFAVFAWLKVTDSEGKADSYCRRYNDALTEIDDLKYSKQTSEETLARAFARLDASSTMLAQKEHGLEAANHRIATLEAALDEACNQNERLLRGLEEYRSMSN